MPQPVVEEDKLDFKKVLPVFVIILIDLMGLTLIIPIMPYYAASFGADAFVIGLLSATYPMMQFFGAPILGGISDKVGRRPVLLVSQLGTFTGFIIMGFANSLFILFLARIIDGISGANIATAQAVITDSTTEKTRTRGLGLIGAAFGLGFIIGPIITFVTLALSDDNYSLVAFIAAGFSLLSITLSYFWLEETLPPEKRGQGKTRIRVGLGAMVDALRRPQIGFLLLLMFAYQFAFGGYEHMLSLFTLDRLGMNASSNAGLFVFAGVIIVGVQGYFVGIWSRRYGDRWLLLFGLAVLAVGLILTAVTPQQPVPWYSEAAMLEELATDVTQDGVALDLPDDSANGWWGLVWILIATFPAAIGGGILQPTINSVLSQQVGADEVGGILGLSAAFFSAANALTPVILGALFKFFGSTVPFMVGGVILLGLYVLVNIKLPQKEKAVTV